MVRQEPRTNKGAKEEVASGASRTNLGVQPTLSYETLPSKMATNLGEESIPRGPKEGYKTLWRSVQVLRRILLRISNTRSYQRRGYATPPKNGTARFATLSLAQTQRVSNWIPNPLLQLQLRNRPLWNLPSQGRAKEGLRSTSLCELEVLTTQAGETYGRLAQANSQPPRPMRASVLPFVSCAPSAEARFYAERSSNWLGTDERSVGNESSSLSRSASAP